MRGLYLYSRREEKQHESSSSTKAITDDRIDETRLRQRTLFSFCPFGKCFALFFLSRARSKRTTTAWEKILGRRKRDTKIKKSCKGLSTHAPLKGPAAPARCLPTNGFQNPRGMSDIFVVLVVLIDACEKSALLFVTTTEIFVLSLFCLFVLSVFFFSKLKYVSLSLSLSCLSLSLCPSVSTIQSQPRTR